ncbi:MAG: CooT family nickel-binding protein [Deltaproteobacteria bacterium]|nr:CooT family nickel-binding protein [Deltaproteobacteria bacterium]
MCLIKVYLGKGEDKELVAEDVAFVVKEEDKIVLRSLDFEDTSTLDGVDISFLDALNSVMVITPKEEGASR